MKKRKIQALPLIQSGLTLANVKVLFRVINEIGEKVAFLSYKDIGEKLGMSYETVRYHFIALEKCGYLTIEKINAKRSAYHIKMAEAKKLANG